MNVWLRALSLVALGLGLVSTASATEERTLFKLNGLDFNESDLSPELRQRVFDVYARYHDQVSEIIRDAAFELHVEDLATKSARSSAAVRAELLAGVAVADAEIRTFYDSNRQRIQMPFEQVRGQIRQYLAGQKQEQARAGVAAQLVSDGTLKHALSAPNAPLVKINLEGFPHKGPKDAPVTIVEFADYQCPHCKAAAPTVKDMLRRFPSKVKLVFVDFPINPSGISRLVAKGGVCANSQGRFWDYHDLAFARQSSLTASAPESLATELGLDMDGFKRCYGSQESELPVAKAEAEAARVGISSTPTLYVNGQRVRVTRSMAVDLDAAVQKALAKSGN